MIRSSQVSANVAQKISPYAWYVVLILAVTNFFNYMDRMALALLAPAIKLELHLSDAQLGILIGLAFSIFYAGCGIPIARWADRSSRRNIIALALVTWSAMTALSGAARDFWQLFLARVGVGVGEAGCIAPSQSIACDYIPLRRRPAIFALLACGSTFGTMLGMVFAGSLADAIGWRWTFVALGLPGIGWALLLRFTLREPVRGAFDPEPAGAVEQIPLGATIALLWSRRTFRLVAIYYALSGFANYGLTQWWPSLYARAFGMSPSAIGAQLGLLLGLGSVAGLIMGGLMADRLARHDVRFPLWVGAATVTLSVVTAIGTLFVAASSISVALVGLTSLFWSIPSGTVAALGVSSVPAQMRTTAGAINILFAAVLGFSLGPLSVGLASDALTPSHGPAALRFALLIPVAIIPLMAGCLYRAGIVLREDLETVSSVAPRG
jgi:predicted MFS family arabinose efflux permease